MKLLKYVILVAVIVVLVLLVLCTARRRCMTTCTPETPVVTEPAAEVVPEPSAGAERMADPVYVEALKTLTVERRSKAVEASAIRVRMEKRVAAVMAGLKAEAGAAPAAVSPVVDVAKIQDEALRERLSRDPEWVALEAEKAAVQRDLADIQRRVATLIRERMKAQTNRRPRPAGESTVKPAPVIHATNMPPIKRDPVVITNAPVVRGAEDGGQTTEDGGQKAEDGGQTTAEVGGQTTEDGGQTTEDGGSPQVRPPDGE